jgi:hypothetical protein
MIHFSHFSGFHVFSTFSLVGDKAREVYWIDPSGSSGRPSRAPFRVLFEELSRAMQVDAAEAFRTFTSLTLGHTTPVEEPSRLSPAEFDVIQTLSNFHSFVTKGEEGVEFVGRSRVFSYQNLNTGQSFYWVHGVERVFNDLV